MSNRKNFVPLQPQRVQRTPPGTPTPTPNRDDSTIVDPNVSSCRMCNQTDNSEMVQCDKCKGWHHFQCVGVTATVANNPWQCLKCKETGKKKNVKPTDTVQTPTKKKSTEKVPQTTGGQTATKVTQKKSVPISTDNLLTKETQGLTVNTPKGDTQSVKTVQTPEAVPTTNVQSTTKPSDDTNVQSTPSQVQRPKSIEATADVMNISIRSSISSKRRSVLMLEKLTKEKAIQDKLIEDKAKLESEFLQKEYEIRESMTDSEDEEFPDERVETNEYVKDWLQSSTSNPVSKEDILRNLGAMREQMLQKAMDQIRLNQAKIAQEDVPLTAPKRVQFSQTLTDISDDPTDDGTVYVEQPGNSIDQINRPPGYETENQTFDVRTLAGQIKPSTSQIVQEPKPPEIGTRQSNEISSQSSLGTLVHPDHSDTTPYDPETQNQQRLRSIAANFTDWSTQSSQPRVPIMAQNQTQSSVPLQAPTQGLSTVSTTSPFQPSTAPMLIHQPIISLQQSTPISNSQSTAASIYQQSMAHFVGQPIPPFSIPLQSSVYPTNQPPYQQIPPFISNMNLQPPVTAVISLSNPTLHDHTSNSNQPPYIPSFSHQQPIVSPVAHSPFANPYQQAIGDPNATINVNTYGQQLPLTTNQSYIYDAQLNPQQIPPSRLQLAARQTMPKDYPKFNGDPQKWSIFYNAYANCTVTCGLSNGENLSRIERSLEDPARRAVKTLLSRPEAVPEIIETLKILYGRPEASIEAQIQYIRNEPPPKMHKMETFIDFSMSVRNVTTEIEKSGMWQYLWNPQLLQDLVDKLPYQMKMDWGHIKLSTPNSNLSTFSNWLFTRARTACAITLPNSDKRNNKSNPDNHVNTHSKGNDSNKKSPQHPTNSKSKNCQVCNTNSHETRECRKFIGMPLNDRWETVKANKICRICLGNHHVQRCDSKSLCGEAGCMIKHHRLLHNPSRDIPTSITEKKENVHSAHQHNKIVIFRRYIPVTLYGPNGSLNVLAFLDEGSDMTLIESWIVTKLGITGVLEDLFLRWTAKIVRREPNSQSISLKISGTKTNQRQYDIRDVRTVKSLNLPPQTVNIDQLKITYKFLRRIPIESYTDETPKILIGLKDCKLITPTKVRSGEWDEPIAAKTLLGWEIHGANTSSSQVANLNSHTEDENNDENLHRMIEKFFSLENFGVMKPEQTIEALSDKRARQLLESTTKRIGDRFETGLLWKYDDVSLPDSLPMTKRRLESLEKRLQKDPELALLFRSKFHEYIEKGYVRKLSTEEAAQTNERTWYLPLFPVTYPKKPGKIRLVWDAAAKVANVSLNSMLLSGPDMLVSLPGVLYRFRERAFAITGDIKEMFHQIAVRKRDQMSQRFLWKESGSSKVDVYVLEVLSFGATSSPSSAQHVKNRNAREFAKQYPRAEEAIRKNTYVDDWLQSFDTEAEAESVAKEVKYVHSRGGFEIRNWLSSSPNVARNLGENPTEDQKLSFDQQETQTERVLGMWWDVKSDAFTYSLRYNPINKDILFNGKRPTKREALRTLMSIYDPIGLLASYLVQLKMILQDIWRTHIGWDEQIKEKDNDQIYARWLSWIAHLPDIERISIKRHYSNMIRGTNPTKIELHVFTDAGELAYATVAYFRIEDQSGVDVSLIGGKTKVAPLKPLSIPRMELQAAVLGARFKNTLVENHTLKIERIVMWTDSSTVLSWLRSDLRRYTQYVGARVNEILETTKLVEWRWIPSKMNPADDATKYKTSFNLDTNNRWFQGPQFLRKAEQYWPSEQDRIDTTEELRPKYVNAHIKDGNENFSIKFEHFLQWRRTMAFVLRYINNVRASLQKPGFVARYGLLCREELQQGENALIREAQMDAFAQDICKLRKREIDANGRHLPVEKSSPIYRYSPYLDNVNILRMRGRIDAASNVSSDQKRPIILPTNHQITDMIVNEYHSLYKHQNTETVINEIKQRFIIPRLRVLYNKIRRNCQHCKNAFTRPKAPEMAQLPEGRLASFNRTFTFVGIDYAGPYMIMSFRRTVKRWIVVFTCLTVRAVYIDCVESLTTDSCIMAIRRFVARNGPAEKFYSDRGTSFVGANNELKREIEKIDHDLLSTTFTNCYTQWSFNPPYGQHMGGAWERLIRSMKTTLDKTLPKSHYPTHETFITALAEVENIINSRPLTFVSIEADDQEALTPNHFLKGSSNGIKPPGIFPPLPKTLRGNWRYSQQIANEFWKKWLKEYLPMITRRTKWFENVKPVEVGDQVIIVDGDAPRNMWERGVVIEAVKSGQDGCVRRAQVRTVNGIYTRPVTKLAVLDLERPEAKSLTREDLAGGSVTASNTQMAAMHNI